MKILTGDIAVRKKRLEFLMWRQLLKLHNQLKFGNWLIDILIFDRFLIASIEIKLYLPKHRKEKMHRKHSTKIMISKTWENAYYKF